MPRSGDVCLVYFRLARPNPKEKRVICVDPEQNLYLLINTLCYDPEKDIPVAANEIACLTGASHIATEMLYRIYDNDIRQIYDGSRIGAGVRNKICEAVQRHGAMPMGHENLVRKKLCGIDLGTD